MEKPRPSLIVAATARSKTTTSPPSLIVATAASSTGSTTLPRSRLSSPLSTTTAVPPPLPSSNGGGLRSVYRAPEDLRRAALQSAYKTLAPAERVAQDAWATRKADEFAPCPFNFPWERASTGHAGYRCAGGAHFMSDAILAEGVPGLYAKGKLSFLPPPSHFRVSRYKKGSKEEK